MRKILLFVSFFFILPSFSEFNSYSFSNTYFQEDFLQLDSTRWHSYNIGGEISTGSGGLTLSSTNSRYFPFVHSKKNIIPEEGNYSIEVAYQFPSTTSFGVGFGIGNLTPSYPILSYSDPTIERDFIYFDVWQGLNDKHLLQTKNCITDIICDSFRTNLFLKQPTSDVHNLKINFIDDHFVVTHKSGSASEETLINQALLNSKRRPNVIWIGNPFPLETNNNWTQIRILQIKVTSEEVSNDPVVILPGFGGSWDLNAVLTNSPGNNWKIPKFIKEYDGIINSLKNAGYEENKDLFVFAYDWRKSLDSLADDLNNFLISRNINDKKVSFVGHSMGGLVARSYLQKYNNQNTKKIVTVGTPHKGIIDAYGMWEGLTVWDAAWWQKVLHLVATEVNRKSGETELQAARRVSPSVKDLLPTWNYLQKDGLPLLVSQMTWKNDYLLDKNVDALNFSDRIFSGFSSNYQSKNKLSVTNRTNEDAIKGLWQDGKPVKTNTFMFSLGDGYVTSSSSGELFENKISLAGNHGEIISKKENIVKILQEVGVATGSAVGSDHDNRKKVVVFKLNSPGKLEVCQMNICDENLGLVFEDSKMVMVPGFAEEKFEIKVKSLGELGSYELLVGEIDENAEWVSSNGRLAGVNQVDGYSYIPGRNQLTLDPVTNVRNISIYFTNGLEPRDINKTRQEILRQMDVNIGLGETDSFDLLVEKWLAIDNFATSLDQRKTKGMNHKEWSEANNGFVRSKFVAKTPSYFSERLVELYSDLEASLAKDEYDEIFHKLDKRVQLLMLRAFLRL